MVAEVSVMSVSGGEMVIMVDRWSGVREEELWVRAASNWRYGAKEA